MSKYGALSGPYFPAFGLNTGKYGPGKTPYLNTFHTVSVYYLPRSLYKKSRLLKTSNIRRKTTFQNGFQVLSMFYSDLKTATSLNNFLYYIFKHAVSSGFQHLPPLIFISHLLSHLHTETYTYTKGDRKQ